MSMTLCRAMQHAFDALLTDRQIAGTVEIGRGGDGLLLKRRRRCNHLEGRAWLQERERVVRPGVGCVERIGLAQFAALDRVETGPARHRQDVAGLRIGDEYRRTKRTVLL